MKTAGLFTRDDIKLGITGGKKTHDLSDLPPERLWALGLRGIKGMNPRAKHPEMPASGSPHPWLYVLGEAPGENEDIRGEPFVGKSGEFLRDQFAQGFEKRIRINNCVRTRPPANRTPTYVEVECFRPSVVADIEASKPRAILGTGQVPLNWVLGPKVAQISVARGRRFPVQIGTHVCWFYPVHHPSYVLRVRNEDRKAGEKIPGRLWEEVFKRDIRRVFSELEDLQPPVIEQPEDSDLLLLDGKSGDLKKALRFLEDLHQEKKAVGFDIETKGLRYLAKGAKLLSIALSGSKSTAAIALHHPEAHWSKADFAELWTALVGFFRSSVPKVGHNTPFDLGWLLHHMGLKILRACKWYCTQAGAYVLDSRAGGHNLNFVTTLTLGFPLKTANDVDRNKLEQTDLRKVLRYNAFDAKYTRKAARVQRQQLKAAGLWSVYLEQCRRIPTVTIASHTGIPISQQRVRKFGRRYDRRITQALLELRALPSVQRYEQKYGEFKWSSYQDVTRMYRMILRKGPAKGKFPTDEEALVGYGGKISHIILRLRKLSKAKSTYIDPLDAAVEGTVVFSDGRVHPNFNSTRTDTRRLSSDEPNAQNWPKRNPKVKPIRSCFVAGPGNVFLACDMGQNEARCIAMHSKDKILVESFWKGEDIHRVWVEKILRVYPDTCKRRYGGLDEKAIKSFRTDIKNQWTFPAFFGSVLESLANNLEMPTRKLQPIYEEFWHTHRGVKAWQERLLQFYRRHNYVESLTGWRRYGPMTRNMIYNTPIQSLGSDIVVDAWNRLSEEAYLSGRPWLSPIINIHDDLTLIVPQSKLEETLQLVARFMTYKSFDFINVPLLVEASVGPDWEKLEVVGKFQTTDFTTGKAA